MKRLLFSTVILLTLLVLPTGTVFAGSAIELIEVRNDYGGVTFIFRVTGEFSKDELASGFVQVEGGDDYPLYCSQQDAETVVCHTSKKAGANSVVVGFGGARFWTDVPEAITEICYSVWDWDLPSPSDYWQYQGDHCQPQRANDGDAILFYSPYWENTYTYYFYNEGSTNGDGNEIWDSAGQGYYYE